MSDLVHYKERFLAEIPPQELQKLSQEKRAALALRLENAIAENDTAYLQTYMNTVRAMQESHYRHTEQMAMITSGMAERLRPQNLTVNIDARSMTNIIGSGNTRRSGSGGGGGGLGDMAFGSAILIFGILAAILVGGK